MRRLQLRVLNCFEIVWLIQTYQFAVNYGRVESADHEMGSLALDRVVQLDDGFKLGAR